MDDIRWMEAQPDRETLDALTAFDHRRIDIEGAPAVLITYLTTTSPDSGLLAAFHPAADRYRAVPGWVQAVVDRLGWAESDSTRSRRS